MRRTVVRGRYAVGGLNAVQATFRGAVLELGGEGRGQAVNFGGGFFVAGMGLTDSGGLENGQEGD